MLHVRVLFCSPDIPPLKTNMTLKNPPFSIGNSSSFMVDFPCHVRKLGGGSTSLQIPRGSGTSISASEKVVRGISTVRTNLRRLKDFRPFSTPAHDGSVGRNGIFTLHLPYKSTIHVGIYICHTCFYLWGKMQYNGKSLVLIVTRGHSQWIAFDHNNLVTTCYQPVISRLSRVIYSYLHL